jgi:hypothetical protein
MHCIISTAGGTQHRGMKGLSNKDMILEICSSTNPTLFRTVNWKQTPNPAKHD